MEARRLDWLRDRLLSALHPVLPDTLALPPLPPGKPPQQRHITIFTFGLQNWAEVRAAHVEHDMLKRIFKSRGKGDVDIFHDARQFNDRTCTRHIGIHPKILQNITWNDSFPGWLESLRADIVGVFERFSSITVAFYCRSGTHRSVAGAYILEYIAKMEGWTTSTQHLCEAQWQRTCRGQCKECSLGNTVREEALNWAWFRWQYSR